MTNNHTNNEINKILEHTNAHILKLARQKLPRSTTSKETLNMDIDDLAQQTRIKLWHALEKRQITRLHAYVRRIAQSQSIDILRAHHTTTPLPLDEDGELYQDEIIHEETKNEFFDPATQWEEKENLVDKTIQAAQMIQSLPPRQQQAILCTLREKEDDYLSPIIIDIFLLYDLDIQHAKWSDDKQDEQRLRASLVIARKKLRKLNLHQK